MTEIHPELARRALTLGRLSAIAGGLELDVGELITLTGLFEERLSSFTRVTVDDQFETLSVMSQAPDADSAMASEMRRREHPLAARLGEPVRDRARRYLEISECQGSIDFSVWELGPAGGDGQVGEIASASGTSICRVVGGSRNPDARDVFPALLEAMNVKPAERQLLADVHPLLSRDRPTMVAVASGSAPALTVFYRDIATSDVIRLLVGLRAGKSVGERVGERLGRFAGAAEANEIHVLELRITPDVPPSVRLGVELVGLTGRDERRRS